MLSNFWSNFKVYLTLYFRHIRAYSGLIQPYLDFLMYMLFKNPMLVRSILLQTYSSIFQTLHIVFRQIEVSLEPQFVYARHVLDIFRHIHNVKHTEAYLPTFRYISPDSGIFRILVQLDIFMYIKAY